LGHAFCSRKYSPGYFWPGCSGKRPRDNRTGKSGKQGTTTTYTVDASKAKITQGLGQGATPIDLSNVEVGDKVAVLGNITVDAVVASSVFDNNKNRHKEESQIK